MVNYVWLRGIGIAVALWVAAAPSTAQPRVELTAETVAAFEGFSQALEQFEARRLDGRVPFLWADEQPGRRGELRGGEVLIEPLGDLGETRAAATALRR